MDGEAWWATVHGVTKSQTRLIDFTHFLLKDTACKNQVRWASLVAQTVKNPRAVQETWVQPLGWEDPLEEGKATHSDILPWRIPRGRGAG